MPVDPPVGVVSRLPGQGTALALTIDDGVSEEVVAAYVRLAHDTGIRLTFFPNGCYRSWTDQARALRPLVDSGQIALGNHTWSHPDLTTLSDADVAGQLRRNRDFLLGEQAPQPARADALAYLMACPGIVAVQQLLTTFVGPRRVWVIARVDLDNNLHGDEVEELTRSIESGLRAEYAYIARVDVVAVGPTVGGPALSSRGATSSESSDYRSSGR